MVLPILGPIIGAVGGLIGASAQDRANKRSAYNASPQGIRKNAEEAGFNPLIFAGPTQPHYAPQFGQQIAQAFSQFGDAFTAYQQQKIQTQQAEQKADALQRQLTRQTVRNPSSPVIRPRQRSREWVPGQRRLPGAGLQGEVIPPRPRQAWRAFGIDFLPSPAFSNAEDFEARGGEPLAYGMSPFVTVADVFHTLEVEGNRADGALPEAMRVRLEQTSHRGGVPYWQQAGYSSRREYSEAMVRRRRVAAQERRQRMLDLTENYIAP